MSDTDKKARSRSTELTGGEGFSYEDAVAVYYLTSLLHAEEAPGLDGVISRVAVQQEAQGEPMDDLIVDAEIDAKSRRLSLQVKRSLTISDAATNSDFREIVARAKATRAKEGFRVGLDRYGFVTRSVADQRYEALRRILDWARASDTPAHFDARFNPGAEANQTEIDVRKQMKTLLAPVDLDAEVDFYRHFVALRLNELEDNAPRFTEMTNRLARLSAQGDGGGCALAAVLFREVRQGQGDAKAWRRASLLADLQKSTPLKSAPAFEADLSRLKELATLSCKDIHDDIAGASLSRAALIDAANKSAVQHRLTNIRGLPGAGKSVVLRRMVEAALEKGPILFLKSDRLEGASWMAHAKAIGISAPSHELLAQIGAAGTPILFIDGVDRIAPNQRGVITDLLNAIESDAAFGHWRVVTTSRDQGLEAYRQWLPVSFYQETGVGDLAVESLSDEEAESLAEKLPHLRPLLFGSDGVREIARRPFFASVLAKRQPGGEADETAPTSEVELIEAWWKAGGYNAAPDRVVPRQRALLDCAETGATGLGKSVRVRSLKAETIAELSGLAADDVLATVEEGVTVAFAHDIYFEWAFYKLLIDAGEDWIEPIKAAGEAPLLARVVGLFSQRAFERGDDWSGRFHRIEKSSLRPQWRRTWLLGPADSAHFLDGIAQFEALLVADDFRLLERFLTWFQAERTIPNPVILNAPPHTADATMLVRAADYLGWPSDPVAWRRVLSWLLTRIDAIPASLAPSATTLFAVWQNVLADSKNPMSEQIIKVVEGWLTELESERPPASEEENKWKGLGRNAYGPFVSSLRQLILRAARAYPSPARSFIAKELSGRREKEGRFKDIVSLSPILAETCPDALATMTRRDLIEELPKAEKERERREREEKYERLRRIREKPEAERTDTDRKILSSPSLFVPLGSNSYDFDDIGIDRFHRAFFPPTPLDQPFAALLEKALDEGLKLIRDLSNHATTGWRQIHEINAPRYGTPLAIEVDWPWGRQTFWGDERTYCWYLGASGPQPLQSAHLALAYWAHRAIDAGRNVDEVIEIVVRGHESWTVLGLAASLALETNHASNTVLAQLGVQRLWRADLRRQVQNPMRMVSFAGLDPSKEMSDAERTAVAYLSRRAFHKRSLRELAPTFALHSDKALSAAAQKMLASFPDALPFAYEEEKKDADYAAELREQARIWASWGDPASYKSAPVSEEENAPFAVYFEAPEPPSERIQSKLRENAASIGDFNVLLWAMKSLEAGAPDPALDFAAALRHAKERATALIFKEVAEAGLGAAQSAVFASAALAACFVESEADWGWETLEKAETLIDREAGFLSSPNPYHPKLFLIAALQADLQKDKARSDSAERLLTLAADSNAEISKAALLAIGRLGDRQSALAWIGASMASRLFCTPGPDQDENGKRNYDKEKAHRQATLAAALKSLSMEHAPELAPPPPAWVFEAAPRRYASQGRRNEKVWRRPDIDFNHTLARAVLSYYPFERWIRDNGKRQAVIEYLQALVAWTKERALPSWEGANRDRSATELYEWYAALAHLCVRAALCSESGDAIDKLITPITDLTDDDAIHFAADVASAAACRGVMDAPEASARALRVLEICLDRLLKERCFDPNAYRAGEINGFAMPQMIRDLLFVSVDHAPGAARFANGDWSDLNIVMPLIDRLMKAAGWSAFVMETYLTLCERAGGALSISSFSDHVSPHLSLGVKHLEGWRGTLIPARIAGVVQTLADFNYSLDQEDARKLLTMLDLLVDLGDRRAAALQRSAQFKDVQL